MRAMEPPPAPMVWMSIIDTSTGYPAIQVSRAVASAKRPSSTMPMSAEVPPMSKVMSLRRPESSPVQRPPRTPAAGPESRVTTGRSETVRTVATPPLELMTWSSAETPASSMRAPMRFM